mmetsp:Transcript_27229/g.63441  ORF Transcript_27229/g.63441 Transcript_27229/m.63441 type:complete len:846 (-) Transcript_27229:55-2592(-)
MAVNGIIAQQWSAEEEAQLEEEVMRLRNELEKVTNENKELSAQVQKTRRTMDQANESFEGMEGKNGNGSASPFFMDGMEPMRSTNSATASRNMRKKSSRNRSKENLGSDSGGETPHGDRPVLTTQASVTMVREAQELDEVLREAESEGDPDTRSVAGLDVAPTANLGVIMGSAIAQSKLIQTIIYIIAVGGLVFVLIAKSTGLGDDHHDEHDTHADHHDDYYHHNDSYSNYSSSLDDDHNHRRLGSGASLLATNMAYCVGCAGFIAFFFNLLRQPLIIGYIAGGILIGPLWGLDIVANVEEIADLRSLGLIFLCFMIGLEMDLSELPRMGRTILVSGFFQLPVTAAVLGAVLTVLNSWGMELGSGDYSVLYCAITCAFSSTMLVVKLLTEQAEMDSSPGRMTVGILFFQDIWAIVILAVQPELSAPKDEELLKTAGMIAMVSVVALIYARFVMPAVYQTASKSVELMLVLSLAWCFFMCCLATLPFVELSMELASLISGVALATFPYSMEFNSKIKYIRDFFITFFFAGLGMMLPSPTVQDIGTAIALSILILLARWIGIYLVTIAIGATERVAALSTINLSNVGEFALVICSLGTEYNHVGTDTLKVILWSFMILAVISNQVIPFNYQIYGLLSRTARRFRRSSSGLSRDDADQDAMMQDRTIILLGFHKIAAMLIAHWEHHNPAMLSKVHVIDFHEDITHQLLKRGITCAFGDISSAEVIQQAHPYEAHLVICSIPDTMLRGITNQHLLKVSKEVWPKADVIVTADNQGQVHLLYEAGADYVLRMAKLCAERLHELIIDHSSHAVHHHHHQDAVQASRRFNVFEKHKRGDQEDKADKKQHIMF